MFVILLIIIISYAAGLFIFKKTGTVAAEQTKYFIPLTNELEDGLYSGRFRTFMGLVGASTEFEIRDSLLADFRLLKLTSTPGYGIEEKITSAVNSSGDLNFEATTGATHSASYAKAAIKNAIEKGQMQ